MAPKRTCIISQASGFQLTTVFRKEQFHKVSKPDRPPDFVSRLRGISAQDGRSQYAAGFGSRLLSGDRPEGSQKVLPTGAFETITAHKGLPVAGLNPDTKAFQ
jgi:hypothetical protein